MAKGSGKTTRSDPGARLRRAAYSGKIEKAAALLKAGADPNSFDSESYLTPLHFAAGGGHPDICRLLVEAGAIIDASDNNGSTPLVWGASDQGLGRGGMGVARKTPEPGAHAACTVLLEAGANPSKANGWGLTPLHGAAIAGYPSIIELLLGWGADHGAQDLIKRAPLHYAALCLVDKSGECCALLLEAGADVTAKNDDGRTALHQAAGQAGALRAVMELLGAGADIRSKDKKGRTPLHVAASFGNMDNCRKLIEAGADLWATDSAGRTPENEAKEIGHLDVAEMIAAKILQADMGDEIPEVDSSKGPKGSSRRVL
jgi:ankyrin repeat protein